MFTFGPVPNDKIRYLVQRIAESDENESFDELFRHFFPGMLSYGKLLVNDESIVKDLIQDIFLKLWINRRTLATISNLPGYLYVSLKHNSANYLKIQRKRISSDSEALGESFSISSTDPEELVIEKEEQKKIEDTINSLPKKCRMIFRLIKEEGLKYKEVAGLLDISVKTVEAHMTFAYSRIVECFEELYPSKTTTPFLRKKTGSK